MTLKGAAAAAVGSATRIMRRKTQAVIGSGIGTMIGAGGTAGTTTTTAITPAPHGSRSITTITGLIEIVTGGWPRYRHAIAQGTQREML